MKKFLIILFIFGFSNICIGQKTIDTIIKVYVPIKLYKEKHKDSIIQYDKLDVLIKNGDTLVRDDNYVRPKGRSVPYVYKDSTFLYYYKKIAFNHKHDSTREKTTTKYWKSHINIFFSKSVSKKIKKDFMKFTNLISKEVDSLNISEVKKLENSNYVVYYNGDFEYESRLSKKRKSDFYMHWRKSKIYRCSIKLNPEVYFSEKLKKNKLKELFFQSLGRFKLTNELSCENYFSNCYSDNKKISQLDLELLKYHYSYGICKGTNLKTFVEQHKKAKKLLKKGNVKMMFFHPY